MDLDRQRPIDTRSGTRVEAELSPYTTPYIYFLFTPPFTATPFMASEGNTAGQPLAIYRRLSGTGDKWRVGHVVLKTLELVSHGRIHLIVLIIVSLLFFIAFSSIVLVIQRIYTVFHPVELFHRCN